MSKELQEKTTNQPAVNSTTNSIAAQELDTGDFTIPRILLMQGTSTLLEDYSLGDIVHSAEEKKLGGKDEPFEILPFYVNKTYEIFEKGTGNWLGRQPWGQGHEELDWEGQHTAEDGTTYDVKNVKNYNVYVLLTGEDTEEAFPCVISFRSSAGKDAKKITSHFIMMTRMQKAPYNVVWDLSSERVQAETAEGKKAFQKYVLKKKRNATEEEIEAAYNWLQVVAQQKDNITYNTEETEINETTMEATPTKTETKQATTKPKNHAPNAKQRPEPSSFDAAEEMPF